MIKLVILDVDGVMTDGKKYYDRDGNVVDTASGSVYGGAYDMIKYSLLHPRFKGPRPAFQNEFPFRRPRQNY